MSARLFLLPEDTLTGAEVGTVLRLSGPEARHAVDVVRVQEGEELLLADGSGVLARCTVTTLGHAELDATVTGMHTEPQPAQRFVLVQALSKGDRDLLAIETATELGVDGVVPWQAERSIVRWRGERADKAARKWEQTLRAATKQARRARVPRLHALLDRQGLVAAVAAADLALVLHEEGELPLAQVELPPRGEVLLIVGPEGGISRPETAALVAAGALVVRLGPTVLRASTAGPAALAALSARGRWR